MSRALVPYLSVHDGAAAIAFYAEAFGAEELQRYDFEGKVGHAALRINGAPLFLADEFPQMADHIGHVAPPTLGDKTTFAINMDVDDVDAWFQRAVDAGCTVVRAPSDEFYGRHAKVRDPFGHCWAFVKLVEAP